MIRPLKLQEIRDRIFASPVTYRGAAKRYYEAYTIRLEQLVRKDATRAEIKEAKEQLLSAHADLMAAAVRLDNMANDLRSLPTIVK